MSTRQDSAPSAAIEHKADLVQWIARGAKPASDWRIGTEHEKFLFDRTSLKAIPYDGERGVRAIMQGLVDRFGWEPILEGATMIALKRPEGELGGTVSLEPGGQFELSGAPLASVHDVADETAAHIAQVRAVAEPMDVGMLGLGFTPLATRADMPTMPKQRYAVMTRYMPKVGTLGLDMMYRTSTIQVNLDFSSEADMVEKLRVSLALQPIATALFAASPFTEGRPNGFKSMRSEVWRHTDRDRTGMLPFVFEAGMGYERYVDYALDVPMYFVYRDGHYIDAAGASFRDFLAGRLAALPGQRPTLDDWSDHMTTLFPEVRLKRFLEMRGADCGPASHIAALPAFWVGILYDSQSLAAASALIKDWTAAERQTLRDTAPRLALDAPFRSGHVLDVARDAVTIARAGLKRRAVRDPAGRDETIHLAPIERIADSGRTVADDLLARATGTWRGDVSRVFTTYAF
jgi:glutamate--cysteine ligase